MGSHSYYNAEAIRDAPWTSLYTIFSQQSPPPESSRVSLLRYLISSRSRIRLAVSSTSDDNQHRVSINRIYGFCCICIRERNGMEDVECEGLIENSECSGLMKRFDGLCMLRAGLSHAGVHLWSRKTGVGELRRSIWGKGI